MRVVFLDEAGKSNRSDEPFTVVAGVIVHADEDWLPVERHLEALADKTFGVDRSPDKSFHTTDIYSGRGDFHKSNGWDADRRFALLDELVAIPNAFGLPILYGYCDRSTLEGPRPGEIQKETDAAHVIAAANCTVQVERAMREGADAHEICLIVMENTSEGRTLLKEQQRFLKSPPPGFVDETNRGWLPLTRIRGTPQFEDKGDASLLQLADVCAFVIKRHLMKADKIERFFGPLRPMIAFGRKEPGHPMSSPWEQTPPSGR